MLRSFSSSVYCVRSLFVMSCRSVCFLVSRAKVFSGVALVCVFEFGGCNVRHWCRFTLVFMYEICCL